MRPRIDAFQPVLMSRDVAASIRFYEQLTILSGDEVVAAVHDNPLADVAGDVHALNDTHEATLFKRRSAAEAVRRLLGRGLRVVQCTTRTRKGRRVPVLASATARARRRRK